MVREKHAFRLICEHCDKEIIGFSEHHAKQNLIIHQKTSEQCKKIRAIVKKKINEYQNAK